MTENTDIPPGFCGEFIHQRGAREFLWRAHQSGRIGSAYLFVGPYGIGKFACALEWVRFLKCTNRTDDGAPCGQCRSCRNIANWDHADVMILFPMPKSVWEDAERLKEAYEKFRAFPYDRPRFAQQSAILIEMIREVQRFLSTPAGLPGGKFVIIADAHAMNTQAANAFLKTLEEPPPDSHIILTTHRLESILPTIRSRAQVVRFEMPDAGVVARVLEEKGGLSPEDARRFALAAGGSIAEALRFAQPEFIAIRRQVHDLMEHALAGNLIPVWEWVTSAPKSVDYAETLVKVLHSVARDIMVSSAGGKILNADFEDVIAAAVRRIGGEEKTSELVRRVGRLVDDVRRNPQYALFYGAVAAVLVEYLAR